MSDDKAEQTSQDGKRINLSEAYEIHYWSEKYGVSPEELQHAVDAVGPMAVAVERLLKAKRSGPSK